MRDTSLLIVALGAVLVSLCSSKSEGVDESDYDEPIRMASESLVVKSYKDAESTTVSTTASRLEEYQVYQGVMGRPGIDFPVYSYIPATKFSCRGVKKSGYYADLATDCQVFHICDGNRKISFLCPNGTIFRQSHLICDWWFRVDCDKSVELYEESAEQLAADQKIYKARSEERERRRKQGKALIADNGGELTSSEVYALDEPFNKKPFEQNKNLFVSSTQRPTSGRFETRKPERHSKKVIDSGSTEKFPNYKNSRVTDKNRSFKYQQEDVKLISTAAPKVSFVDDITATTPIYKSKYQTQNNIGFESNKENIQPAESGSLVEDLNRNDKFAFYNTKDQNSGSYNAATQRTENKKGVQVTTERAVTFALNNGGSSQTSDIGRTSSAFNNENKRTEQNLKFGASTETPTLNNRNAQSTYLSDKRTEQAYNIAFRENNFEYKAGAQTKNQTTNQSPGNNAAFQTFENRNRNFEYNTGIQANNHIIDQKPNVAIISFPYSTEQTFNNRNTNFEYNTGAQKSHQGSVNFAYESNNRKTDFGYNAGSQNKNGTTNQGFTNSAAFQTFENRNTNFGTQTSSQITNQGAGNNSAYQTFDNRNRNFEYKTNSQITDQKPSVPINNFAYSTAQTFANGNTNFKYNTGSQINSQNNQGSVNFAYKTEQTDNRNTNFGYNEKIVTSFLTTTQRTNQGTIQNTEQTFGERNVNFGYNTRNEAVASNNREGKSFSFPTETEQIFNTNKFDYDVTAYTTEFSNYESKRTNPIERHETVTPTAHTRKTQSSRYRSSTAAYVERPSGENQFFAETASFASNRGSKSYSDYQNQFVYNQPVDTSDVFKTSTYQTPKPTEGLFSTSAPTFASTTHAQIFNQQSTFDYYKTTTSRPNKQHSRKVTVFPSTNPQTTIWQTTTYQPIETTTGNKFTAHDVHFTTSAPREVEITENYNLGLSQDIESQTIFEHLLTTPKPDVDISLQELNINKDNTRVENLNKSYEDFVREGLEVPPSSGPNALRSFALYFANNQDVRSIGYLPVTGEAEITTTISPSEIKKKEVVKQVDEIVQKSANVSEHHETIHTDDSLPNSLTPHTKDSYSALFPSTAKNTSENASPSTEFETIAFESFTEQPNKINTELTKNDLDGSQSRGLVEPDPSSDNEYRNVSPDLRELAQVFTKALSAYLDDPETFRRVLSEIRPTEPTIDSEISSSSPIEYPSATQEDDEVLDFSDVTKSTYKKKLSTSIIRETTTEFFTESPTTSVNDVENFVLPLNSTSWATNIELTAPLFESLDESQSSYYTAPPYIGTTNAIAEEINNEFQGSEKLPPTDSNETVDSYLPVRGSVDDPSLPRYGGFQNNTKYIPYGADLTSTTYKPYGADLTTPNTAASTVNDNKATTFNPNNVTSFFSHFSKNESEEGEIQLGKELNNLVLLQKFTTPRGAAKETTTPEPILSTIFASTQNDINRYQDIQLGNGETIEKSTRGGKSLHFSEADVSSNYFEPNPKEINLELSPPSNTPKGFLITYAVGGISSSSSSSSSSEPATYLPKATTPEVQPTTYSPNKITTPPEIPTPRVEVENYSDSVGRSSTEFYSTVSPTSKPNLDRLAQLQETLMFNTNNITTQQKDQARVSVEEMMDTLNMTDSTANTLMKMMEMAAKNETYRRLVLLLVNDKSGKNKTVEEARLSLLKALLTPVISPQRTVVPIPETSLIQESRQRGNLRRSKSISSDVTGNVITTTPLVTTSRRSSLRRVKVSRGLTRAESNYNKSGLGNLGLIRRTIENSKNKQVRINSVDDAILDSDSRAVELLRSLYSLAARWG